MYGAQCVKHGTLTIAFVNNHIKGLIMDNLKSFVKDCVHHYAKFDSSDEFYSLDVQDLPDFVQNEFAAVIMSDDNAIAAEATGPDNKHWDSRMLPALTKYLRNSTDKDEEIEFRTVWRDCVTDYFTGHMQHLLDECVDNYNNDEGYTIKDPNHYYGVSHLFGA